MNHTAYWPGQQCGNLAFLPGGISIGRDAAVIPVKRGKGNKIEHLNVVMPSSWQMQMLRLIETKAYNEGCQAGDYFLQAPFHVIGGEIVITEALINQYAMDITITQACTAEIGVQTLPFFDEKGGLVHIQKEVMTVTTFGKVVMHVDMQTGDIMLAFEVSAEIERRFEGITISELVTMAKQEVVTDHFRMGGVIVFPKIRRGSKMVPNVLAMIETTFTRTEETSLAIEIDDRAW